MKLQCPETNNPCGDFSQGILYEISVYTSDLAKLKETLSYHLILQREDSSVMRMASSGSSALFRPQYKSGTARIEHHTQLSFTCL